MRCRDDEALVLENVGRVGRAEHGVTEQSKAKTEVATPSENEPLETW